MVSTILVSAWAAWGSAHAQSDTYSYDTLGRLTSVTNDTGAAVTYAYDQAGNRTQISNHTGLTLGAHVFNANLTGPTPYQPLANDHDPDGYALHLDSFTNGANGVVAQIDNIPTLTYTPNSGSLGGPDRFGIRISNGHGKVVDVPVTVNVDRPPVAVGATFNIVQGAQFTFNPHTTDSDPDGDNFYVEAVSQGAHGSVAIASGGGVLTYTAAGAGGYVGPDSFTYRINDGRGGAATATINVNIANAPPVLVDDYYTIYSDGQPLSLDVLANDHDPGGDALTIQSVSIPLNYWSTDGTRVNALGAPGPGAYTFTYVVADSHGATSQAVGHVTVPNRPPIAPAETLTTNTKLPVTSYAVTYAWDPDSSPGPGNGAYHYLTLSGFTQPAHGVVAFTDTGFPNYNWYFTYSPKGNFVGTDPWTYTVTDPDGASTTGAVNIDVHNTPPAPSNVSVPVGYNTPYTFDPRPVDYDGDSVTISAVGAPSHGSATINSGASITYTPATGYSGSDTFSYTVTDGRSPGVSATVTAQVAPPAALSITVNSTTYSRVRNAKGGYSTATPITVSASGGNGCYTYSWEYVSGDSSHIVLSTTNPANWAAGVIDDGGYSAVWRCKVTDSSGLVGYSPNITVKMTIVTST